jgi:hypothetical protein
MVILTSGEEEVLACLKERMEFPPERGQSQRIADYLEKHRAWVAYVMKRLVGYGLVKKTEAGYYEVAT